MSVRVVARIRPLLKKEIEKDVILTAADNKTVVRIPNPKNDGELYSFQFSSVYDQTATQSDIFDHEVAPTVKHLFKGFDVTLFAYGVTGTGKTHTMRGGKALADRGVIPRLLSSIYRRARKVEKDSSGQTEVEVAMSYYEIYNDRVFDLFEPPEKRTPAGLPIRDNQSGKAVVVGLTERPCTSLKEFERLYDEANVNRSTSATKLNAHSSRSHAVLCVKVVQTTGDEVRMSTVSAIDLAGSEDNRRTDNNKERLVESASINKSLFVLASCVEAISKKQTRIPYRESKMTRILALGQNNGLTVMILNLAPVRSYHLDTLSSLNFANRTKKIEVNEIENQPFFREQPGLKSKLEGTAATLLAATAINRQPLRPKVATQISQLKDVTNVAKPAKSFSVFSDKPKPGPKPSHMANTAQSRSIPVRSPKRNASMEPAGRIPKALKLSVESGMSKDAIEAMIERKVSEALAGRVDQTTISTQDPISDEVQRRLDALEKRVEGQETERAEGLQYLLMAKQHQVRGEDVSALKMYQLALPHFPDNEKLVRKLSALQDKIDAKNAKKMKAPRVSTSGNEDAELPLTKPVGRRKARARAEDESWHEGQDEGDRDDAAEEESGFVSRPQTKIRRPQISHRTTSPDVNSYPPPTPADDSEDELAVALSQQTPRTKQLLSIINTKDVSRIKLLKGVGPKKAEAIVNCLCDLEDDVATLGQLGKLKGVGVKTVENMRAGLVA